MLRFEQEMYANPEPGPERAVVGPGREVPAHQAARGSQRARLRRQDPHRLGPGLLPQLHDGPAVRLPGPRHDRPRGAEVAKDIPNAFYTDNKEVGEYMKSRVFAPGATLSWNELTKHATGEDLNAKAFAAEFARSRGSRSVTNSWVATGSSASGSPVLVIHSGARCA